MKRFEYKYIKCGYSNPFIDSNGNESLTIDIKSMNKLGYEGWELITIDNSYVKDKIYIFKREI